jgi:TolB-like protein
VAEGAMRYVWLALVAAFPLAAIWAWRYDITADGIVRTLPATAGEHTETGLRAPDYAILAGIAVVAISIFAGLVNEIRQLPEENRRLALTDRPIISSIAVLPFENLSGDSEKAYIAAGMHDALINGLARISSFRVISRTSTLRLPDDLSVPEIANRLGVDKVIEGSVTTENDSLRIIVQLIDAEHDEFLWSENYVRPFQSLVALQNEMASSIAGAVQVRLTPDEARRLESRGEVDPDTYDAYLRAMYKFRRESAKGIREGIEILSDAVENDPTSALAWAGLAYGYLELGHSPFPQSAAVPRAEAAAQRAIQLDPDLAQAHLAVGMFKLYYEWDLAGAEEALLNSLELNPSLINAHYHLAWLNELYADHEAALDYGVQTKILDPLSPFYSGWLAEQYRSAGLYEEAIAEAGNTLDLRRNYPVAFIALGNTYADMGDMNKALDEHAKLADSGLWSFMYGATLARAGRADEALEIAARLEERNASVPLTLIYAALGDRENAMKWLMEARDGKAGWYPWLLTWFPQTGSLQDDPEIRALAGELGL